MIVRKDMQLLMVEVYQKDFSFLALWITLPRIELVEITSRNLSSMD